MTREGHFVLVAGPGGAPGLEDYADLTHITVRVGLYHVRSCKLNVPWRLVSTDSP